MKEAEKLRWSNELTKVHIKFRKLGASEKDLKHFNNIIKEIEEYRDDVKLGDLF